MGYIKYKTYMLALFFMLCFVPSALADSPLINLNVVDEDVGPVFNTLAKIGGMNVVIDEGVTGKVTIQLKNIPLDTAIDIVAKLKGLVYYKLNDVLVVGPADKMSRGFGNIHIFKLSYAQADKAAELVSIALNDGKLPSANDKTGTPSGSASSGRPAGKGQAKQADTKDTGWVRLKVDSATNSLIFMGSPDEADKIKKVLAEIDVPYEQVTLEAQVVSVNKSASKNLGIEWEWDKTPTYPEYDEKEGTYTRTKYAGTIRYGKSPIGVPYEFYYQAKINALVTDGKADILARPKVTTINGKEATINIGEQVPIPVTTTQNNITTTSIEYKDVGIILKYTPRVNADGYITATVHTEVSTPTYVPEMKAYKFSTRSADTEVRLKDGETMVIGGLIGKEESRAVSKIPFLADLPLVGKLFRNNSSSSSETEVVIFLTARIVK